MNDLISYKDAVDIFLITRKPLTIEYNGFIIEIISIEQTGNLLSITIKESIKDGRYWNWIRTFSGNYSKISEAKIWKLKEELFGLEKEIDELFTMGYRYG